MRKRLRTETFKPFSTSSTSSLFPVLHRQYKFHQRVLRFCPYPANQMLQTGAFYRPVEISPNLDWYEGPTWRRLACGNRSKFKMIRLVSLWWRAASNRRHPEDCDRKLHRTEQSLQRLTVKPKVESWREPRGGVCSLSRVVNFSVFQHVLQWLNVSLWKNGDATDYSVIPVVTHRLTHTEELTNPHLVVKANPPTTLKFHI